MLPHIGSSAAQMFTLRIGFALALGASVTGCAVGPKLPAPVSQPAAVHNARRSKLVAPPCRRRPSTSGGRASTNPKLTRMVKRALDENLDLPASTRSSLLRSDERTSRPNPFFISMESIKTIHFKVSASDAIRTSDTCDSSNFELSGLGSRLTLKE